MIYSLIVTKSLRNILLFKKILNDHCIKYANPKYLHTKNDNIISEITIVNLKNLCLNKIFWSAITASFAFSILLFNITMGAIEANADAIQITNEDIKQILSDTSYIRGIIENNQGN